MADLKFKPVPHDHPEFIERAKLKPGDVPPDLSSV